MCDIIMVSSTSQMVVIFLGFILCATSTLNLGMCHENLNVGCNEKDRQVLAIFMQSIKDPLKLLSSWSSEADCCKWTGVQCDNTTGRVTKLDLHCSYFHLYGDSDSNCLEGEINLSVLQLEFLSFLDLHGNDFKTIQIPPIHGSTNSITSHNLWHSNFSNLLYLDLSLNYNIYMGNLTWVSHLSSLKYLNLSGVPLRNETHWLQIMTMFPSLLELRLENCQLSSINPSLEYVNFPSLSVLDLSNNFFGSEVPKWLSNISISYLDLTFNDLRGQIPEALLNLRDLKYLTLSYNDLNGSIPEWMGQYKHLETLDLSHNSFSGPIPAALGNLSSLTYLVISSNHLIGNLPQDLVQLSKLETLMVGHNSLAGILTEHMFTKLSNLKMLEMDSSAFIFEFDSHWRPPFQLEYISISHCMLGPEFPSWLYTQKSLFYLDISSSGLSFRVHDKFWSFIAQIDYLILENNTISGDILDHVLINSTTIDLSSNNFSGGLPRLSPQVTFFNIANNSFSGPIYPLLCQSMHKKFNLIVLDMSKNLLSGQLPADCWMHWQSLRHVNLASNKLTGLIPSWTSQLTMALLLRSNKFSGTIPPQICGLSNLLVLDVAYNRLSGTIPECLSQLTTMVTNDVDEGLFIFYFYQWTIIPSSLTTYLGHLPLLVKGQELDHWSNFKLVRIVDLSSNDLVGSIPPQLLTLIALQSLNLSHNHLMGNIPYDIGDMKNLESLDLSGNQLSGEIPQNMANLSFLSMLNLSYNDFNGRIPLGTQLQSFDEFSYIGNPELCGAPLTKNCTQEERPNGSKLVQDNEDDFTSWFYIGMGVGFAFGFWGVCGSLFFIRKWRHAYFMVLDKIKDKLYVIIALMMNRFR